MSSSRNLRQRLSAGFRSVYEPASDPPMVQAIRHALAPLPNSGSQQHRARYAPDRGWPIGLNRWMDEQLAAPRASREQLTVVITTVHDELLARLIAHFGDEPAPCLTTLRAEEAAAQGMGDVASWDAEGHESLGTLQREWDRLHGHVTSARRLMLAIKRRFFAIRAKPA